MNKNKSIAAKKRWQDPNYREKMLKRKRRNYTKEARQKLRESFMGDKNPLWKGKEAGYTALHLWIRRKLGSPDTCSKCKIKSDNPRILQWANIDHKYRRNVKDYIPLCAKCHSLYDLLFNNTRDYIRKDSKSGHTGIHWEKERQLWVVQIQLGKKVYHKRFKNLQEAVKQRKINYDRIFNEVKKEFGVPIE